MGSVIAGFASLIFTFLTLSSRIAPKANLTRKGLAALNYNKKEAAKILAANKATKAANSNKVNQLNEPLSTDVVPVKSIKGLDVNKLPIKTGLTVGAGAYLYDKADDALIYVENNKKTIFFITAGVFALSILATAFKRGK